MIKFINQFKFFLLIISCIFLAAGCGNDSKFQKGITNENIVDKVISSQIYNGDSNESYNYEMISQDSEKSEIETQEELSQLYSETEDMEESNIDFDLTAMNSDMVYVTVYQMMVNPAEYEGKTFRMGGQFYSAYYEPTDKYYFYCVIQDATACCAQGMEFVWDDGSHIYPDEYPKENDYVVVEGTFETYKEEGDDNLYCRLANANMEFSN